MSWDNWNKGVYLVEAHTRFGDKDTVGMLNENRNKVGLADILDRIQGNAEKGLEGFDVLKDVVKPDFSKRKLFEELERKLKEDVLRNVTKGALIAFGFSVPRHADDIPQRVPNDLWDRYLYSSGNNLKSSSLKMEAIRIVRKEVLVDQLSSPTVEQEEMRSAGRPSRKGQIVAIFHGLADAGEIDFSKPKTHCYTLIRNRVLAQYPVQKDEEKGLGDKAIQKHISLLFDTKKNAPL